MILRQRFPFSIGAVLVVCLSVHWFSITNSQSEEIRFTSVPDIFNWNISNPQPGWEDTLDWFFDRLQQEGPDFTLNAGDIMDARWWDNEAQVKRKTEEYWGGFMKRFNDRGMTVYVAPGDHEYGDDGGLRKGAIARAFGEQFTKIMGMPKNGPANHIGRSFSVRKGNLLVVTLDTFEDEGQKFGYTVGKQQLAWLEETFQANEDADFVIVQGHLPIAGPVRSKNSSASMLKGGTKSALWKLMVKHGVDVYLCGEHHRITVKKQDGIWQIVHGALWGTQTDLNYLRGVVQAKQMTLELVEFDVAYSGGYIGDHPHRPAKNKPRENVVLTEKTKSEGPRVTGALVLTVGEDNTNEATKAEGWFANVDKQASTAPAKPKQAAKSKGGFQPLAWKRPVDNPVFTTEFGNNHDSVLFVEQGQEYPYYLIVSHTKDYAQLWRAKKFSWSSANWELVEKNYKIAPYYEFDDGVKVGNTYYIYEEGNVYTYQGALEESSGKWKKAGTFPKKQCDDLGVYYEDGIFHIFGEHGHFPHGPDGTSLAHFTSKTGLGDWQLVDPKAVDPNPGGGHKYGVGDATIAKIDGEYYIFCDRESKGSPYKVTAWKSSSLSEPFTFLGKAITPRSDEVDDWDNHRIQDPDIAYIPELGGHVITCNMMDKDGNPGGDFPTLGKKQSRVIGVFYHEEVMRKLGGN